MLSVVPVLAIQFGEPDTDPERYPSVGMAVFFDGESGWRCSGTLIDPYTVLTAGHCTEGAVETWVGFQQAFDGLGDFFDKSIAGTSFTHPDFAFPFNDVGIIKLDEMANVPSVPMAAPGTLDPLASKRGQQNTKAVITGYGVQDWLPPDTAALLERYHGEVRIIDITSDINRTYGTVQVSANRGEEHSGGLCFGDSGGPILYDSGDGLEIVAVNSFVINSLCMGSGFSQRVDNVEHQAWIAEVGADND